MFRPYMWAIFRLRFNLQSSYTRCVGCSFRVLAVEWGEGDLVFSVVGTMTWGCYKKIIISCLCTYIQVGYYSNAKDMLQIVSLVILVSIYLRQACYNVIVRKTLAIISWCHSVSVSQSYCTAR